MPSQNPLKTSREEYLVVEAALHGASIKNIGILLLDAAANRLHCRFRRDFVEFAGDEADWFENLADHISAKSEELGGQECLEWMESTLSNTLLISPRDNVLVDNAEKSVDRLYAKYIEPTVLAFRTHLPQYSLEAAAGKFGKQMDVEPEGWVEVPQNIPLTEDMFVAHVKGESMEPKIPDGSLCVFKSKPVGPLDGKVVLMEHFGEAGGNRYTVQVYRPSKNSDPDKPGDSAWLHERITLEPLNHDYKDWDVAAAAPIHIIGEFRFVI